MLIRKQAIVYFFLLAFFIIFRYNNYGDFMNNFEALSQYMIPSNILMKICLFFKNITFKYSKN